MKYNKYSFDKEGRMSEIYIHIDRHGYTIVLCYKDYCFTSHIDLMKYNIKFNER